MKFLKIISLILLCTCMLMAFGCKKEEENTKETQETEPAIGGMIDTEGKTLEEVMSDVEKDGYQPVLVTVYEPEYADGYVFLLEEWFDGVEKGGYVTVAVNDLSLMDKFLNNYQVPPMLSTDSLKSVIEYFAANNDEYYANKIYYSYVETADGNFVLDYAASKEEYAALKKLFDMAGYDISSDIELISSKGYIPTLGANLKAQVIDNSTYKEEITSSVIVLSEEVNIPSNDQYSSCSYALTGNSDAIISITVKGNVNIPLDLSPFITNLNLDSKPVLINTLGFYADTTDDGFKVLDGKVLVGYTGEESDLTVPEGIEYLTNTAFNKNESLNALTLPDTLISISDYTFNSCSNLTSVNIPDTVIGIGRSAFSYTSIDSIHIPASIKRIDKYAFDDCNIKKIYIDDLDAWFNIDFGEYSANPMNGASDIYLNGELLTELVIPDTVKTIKNDVLGRCPILGDIVIPDGVTTIGSYAFAGSSLTSVTIPDSVTQLDANALSGCQNLTEISLPDSVSTVEESIFHGCTSLTKATLSEGMSYIGIQMFYECSSLTEVIIPDSVTEICYRAFEGCISLKSIIIPESVTEIGDEALPSTLERIIGAENSAAHTYALEHNIEFVPQ